MPFARRRRCEPLASARPLGCISRTATAGEIIDSATVVKILSTTTDIILQPTSFIRLGAVFAANALMLDTIIAKYNGHTHPGGGVPSTLFDVNTDKTTKVYAV